ncbi:trypsin-like peptidase domain-containing protein [Mycobacterium sp.]|uniref:trypsin-like peptidase domain-containing protein n=1 Tax=Mycobacterium sp. TaxID=1785 RepID=UPI003BAE307B
MSRADQGARPKATPVQLAENLIRPAVVYIEGDLSAYVGTDKGYFTDIDQPFKVTISCTGFVVNPTGYVGTAGHCADLGPEGARADIIHQIVNQDVQKDPTIDASKFFSDAMANWKIEGQAGGSPIDQKLRVAIDPGPGAKPQVLPARVVEVRPVSQGDVALLKVEATDLPSSELAAGSDVQVGQQVVSIGYPASTEQITDFSLNPDNKDGTISAIKTDASVPVYETDSALSQGMSGGPTVGIDGKVLGVNSRLPAGETQAFNFIAPASGLTELLTRNGTKAELGPLDVQFRSGLTDYYAGHYTSAIATFDKILALSRNYGQAAVFKTNATKAQAQFGDVPTSSGFSALWFVLGGVALVAVAAAVMVLLLRRRGLKPAGAAAYFPGQGSQPRWNPTIHQPAELTTGADLSDPHSGSTPVQQRWSTPPDSANQPPPSAPVTGPVPSGANAAPADSATAATNRYCSNCGAPHSQNARFCPGCGHATT